ncbi:MAG: DUF58 domain-containing protein [Caulobacteraceae bacterium]|nr:DUF58 domain-containing protein [Caulobacter sp.]
MSQAPAPAAAHVATTPTPRAIALAAGLAALALALGALRPQLWTLSLAFTFAAGALPLVDLLRAVGPDRLRLQVDAPSLLPLGQRGEVRLAAGFEGGVTPPALEAALLVDDRLRAAPRLQPMEEARAAFDLSARRRGRLRLEAAQVRWAGPWGLVRRQVQAPLEREVVVTPDLGPARAAASALSASADAQRSARRRGEGTEFESLRPFAAGDDRRMIAWKRSARHGELLVKEFRLEQNTPLVLAVDTGRRMSEPLEGRPRVDHALSAALALGYAALRAGDRVKLAGFDAALRLDTPFMAGVRAFSRLQVAGAGLEYSAEEANYTLGLHAVGAGLERRSVIVVFTEFTDTVAAELMLEAAGRLTRRHQLVFSVFRDDELEGLMAAEPRAPEDVSRAVVAADLARERRLVIERLRRMGVVVVETRPGRISGALIDAYLDLKRRNLA